jgi:hypothetical protein
MKYLKMLGLAAIAAMAFMAFIGAGTASATALCETTPATGTDCPLEWKVLNEAKLDFSNEETVVLTGPFGETIDTCAISTVEGEVTETGGTEKTVKGKITKLVWEGCTRPTTTIALGELEVHHELGTDNGTVTSTGTTVRIENVPLFGTCNYATNATDIGTLTGTTSRGGKDPTFDIAATISSEANCPKGTWEGSYVYTGTTTFDVVAG